jgi:hypothetical protein
LCRIYAAEGIVRRWNAAHTKNHHRNFAQRMVFGVVDVRYCVAHVMEFVTKLQTQKHLFEYTFVWPMIRIMNAVHP